MKDIEVKYLGIAADYIRNVYLLHFEVKIINPNVSNHELEVIVDNTKLWFQTNAGKTEKLNDTCYFYYAMYKENTPEIVNHERVKELIKKISPSVTVTYNIFNNKESISGNYLQIGNTI